MRERRLNEKKVKAALVKKALGYDATEVVEEYVSDEAGEVKLSKVTKKNVPPDMSALKMLMDEAFVPVGEMSDEELEKEKERLIKELSEKQKKENKR